MQSHRGRHPESRSRTRPAPHLHAQFHGDALPLCGPQDCLAVSGPAIIPLIKIQVRETGYPAIYVSDRRCTIGIAGQLYLPRLLEFDGIQQSIGNASDEAHFTFGNADRVMRDLANDTDLNRASIEFSLFHVGTGIKLDLWKGEISDWEFDDGPEFRVTAPMACMS